MIRIGNGYDVHVFSFDRKLMIGCVEIPFEKGLLGHSDADVLCHAIADAMLGAVGLGDIGVHFPDNDPACLGISGFEILHKTAALCRNEGYSVSNIDSIVVAQRPKLAPFIPEMKRQIADAVSVSSDRVNVKATTEEKLGFTGKELGIAAHAVCMMIKE